MNDQNAQNDRLQISLDQVRQDIEDLTESQSKIDQSLETVEKSFRKARIILLKKLHKNNGKIDTTKLLHNK